ncbi:MAG TPA: PKD domain-containing protein, partial [Flavisolibacter sp.]|nr:PKD domain-containing protein [Flavisolibacter sp.]
IKNPGCQSSFDTTIKIDSVKAGCIGKADFTWDGPTVAPATIQFKNLSTPNASLTWDFGDGSLSTEINPQHLYLLPGTYNVALGSDFGRNCFDSVLKTIVINPPSHPDTCLIHPYFVFIYDSTKDRTVQFTDVSISNKPITGYKWDFSDGQTSTISNPVHQFSAIGLYKVCLQISTDSCSASYCDSLTINPTLAIPILVYPNPVTSTLNVSYILAIRDNVDVVLYNEFGFLVKKVTYPAINGVNTFSIPVADLSPGVYIIQINSPKNISNSIKFIKM